jgi:hypothetical protein
LSYFIVDLRDPGPVSSQGEAGRPGRCGLIGQRAIAWFGTIGRAAPIDARCEPGSRCTTGPSPPWARADRCQPAGQIAGGRLLARGPADCPTRISAHHRSRSGPFRVRRRVAYGSPLVISHYRQNRCGSRHRQRHQHGEARLLTRAPARVTLRVTAENSSKLWPDVVLTSGSLCRCVRVSPAMTAADKSCPDHRGQRDECYNNAHNEQRGDQTDSTAS